ncbi:hypothetical protein BDR26DRAFT_940967 [Obelidium mucronatum]|nr:hypothetical protein BDR26DRAFT_940967 [Obelidium mucronatum]
MSSLGEYELVVELLRGPSDVDNEALRLAAENGYLEVVKLLLDERVDPSASNNFAVNWAKSDERCVL